jgi:hypothetical protein
MPEPCDGVSSFRILKANPDSFQSWLLQRSAPSTRREALRELLTDITEAARTIGTILQQAGDRRKAYRLFKAKHGFESPRGIAIRWSPRLSQELRPKPEPYDGAASGRPPEASPSQSAFFSRPFCVGGTASFLVGNFHKPTAAQHGTGCTTRTPWWQGHPQSLGLRVLGI